MIANAGAAVLAAACLLLIGFIAGRSTAAPSARIRVVCVPPSTAAVTLTTVTVLMPAPVGVC